ncbi:hypothetical protein FACS1894125_4240 [Actinomycetota bacterium]|nr:hypothetical protein FACS1894125_4240 [Actinomycetota bacterium]
MRNVKEFFEKKWVRVSALAIAILCVVAVLIVVVVFALLSRSVSNVTLEVTSADSKDMALFPDAIVNGEFLSGESGGTLGSQGLKITTDTWAKGCSLELRPQFVEEVEIPDGFASRPQPGDDNFDQAKQDAIDNALRESGLLETPTDEQTDVDPATGAGEEAAGERKDDGSGATDSNDSQGDNTDAQSTDEQTNGEPDDAVDPAMTETVDSGAIFAATDLSGSGTNWTANLTIQNAKPTLSGGYFTTEVRATCDGVNSNVITAAVMTVVPFEFVGVDDSQSARTGTIDGMQTYDFGVVKPGQNITPVKFAVLPSRGLFDNQTITNIRYSPIGDVDSTFVYAEDITRTNEYSNYKTDAGVKNLRYPAFSIGVNSASPGAHTLPIEATVTFKDGHFLKAQFMAVVEVQ